MGSGRRVAVGVLVVAVRDAAVVPTVLVMVVAGRVGVVAGRVGVVAGRVGVIVAVERVVTGRVVAAVAVGGAVALVLLPHSDSARRVGLQSWQRGN